MNYCVDIPSLPVIVPQQVTGVEFTPNNTNNSTITITWDSPSSELPITHYFVNIIENKLHQRTKPVNGDTTLTIPSTPGSTYAFRVRAVSAVGRGTWSEHVTTEHEYIIHFNFKISLPSYHTHL